MSESANNEMMKVVSGYEVTFTKKINDSGEPAIEITVDVDGQKTGIGMGYPDDQKACDSDFEGLRDLVPEQEESLKSTVDSLVKELKADPLYALATKETES